MVRSGDRPGIALFMCREGTCRQATGDAPGVRG